jgi:hypothetical protein
MRSELGIWVRVYLCHTVSLNSLSELLWITISLGKSIVVSFLGIGVWLLRSWAIHSDVFSEGLAAYNIVAISKSVACFLLDIGVWLLGSWAVHGNIVSKGLAANNIVTISESISCFLLGIGMGIYLCRTVGFNCLSKLLWITISFSKSVVVSFLGVGVWLLGSWAV